LDIYHEDMSRAFVIYGGGLWDRKYLYVDLKGNAVRIADISKLLSGTPLLIQWDPEEPDTIFAIYANYIDRIDISTGALYPKFLENLKGCGFGNKNIFLMRADNSFAKMSQDKSRAEPFLAPIPFDDSVLKKNVFYRITAPGEDLVFLLSEDGQLLTNFRPFQLEATGVVGMKYNERNRTLLFWTAGSLAMARVSPPAGDSHSKEQAVTVLYDKGEDIKQAFWMLDNVHLIFNDNDRIFLLEIEPQGPNHVEFIANIKKNSTLYYDDSHGRLYYLDETGLLTRVPVLSSENVVDEILNKGH
jgi:hypothetical protein